MKLRAPLCLLAALAAISSVSAQANVTFVRATKYLDYRQSSDNGADLNLVFADLVVETATDFEADGGTASFSDGSTVAGSANFDNQVIFSKSFASAAAQEQAFGPGTFAVFLANAGAPVGSGTFEQPSLEFADFTPFLSGDSFSRLGAFDVAQPIDLTFNTGNATSSFSIFGTAFSASGTSGITLPANTLQASTTYTFVMDNRTGADAAATFDASNPTGRSGTLQTTLGTFTTAAPVPEPASMVALGLGVAALLRRRRS